MFDTVVLVGIVCFGSLKTTGGRAQYGEETSRGAPVDRLATREGRVDLFRNIDAGMKAEYWYLVTSFAYGPSA